MQGQSSTLCLACGLCCTGALHGAVEVKAEHAAQVRLLGLVVETVNGRQAFRQPCPLFAGGRCGEYARRPPSCEEFRCTLLRRLERGDVDLPGALALAAEARSLIAQGAALHLEKDNTSPEQLLLAASLDVLLSRHFQEPVIPCAE